MENLVLLRPEIQEYILKMTGLDATKLALSKNPFPEIDFKIVLNQIAARTKSKNKLPTWYNCRNCIYPSKISIEQTSSEVTANYKSELINGNSLIDLSGGFGVDDYYFSKKMKQVIHCEIDSELSSIVSHNFQQLQINNIQCIVGNSSVTLGNLNQKFDWIYVDPSRRNEIKGKVFMLQDCLPNVPYLQEFYYHYASKILVKTAPLLDLTAGLSELKNVKAIHIVAVENEVKELLWEIHQNYTDSITISTVNFNKNNRETFQFVWDSVCNVNLGLPKKYIYEPNNAILKSGGFREVASKFSLDKLHTHSHLYTSNNLIEFPGRIFKIITTIPYSNKEMALHLENKKINITLRNFPDTVDNIRKKWKIKDGGNEYCFFTTDLNNNKIVLICNKIITL
jgi:hypothetical protein